MTTGKGTAFVAFLLGGIVGAGVALLYAPASGIETRKKIKEGVDDAGDFMKGKYEGVKTGFGEGVNKVRTLVDEKKGDLKAAVEACKEGYAKGRERLMKESSM